MDEKHTPHDNHVVVKRGRKAGHDAREFLQSKTGVTFVPSRETREHIIYCMRETGIFNKSALVSLAIKNFHDMLQAEAIRRAQMEDEVGISKNNFKPSVQ